MKRLLSVVALSLMLAGCASMNVAGTPHHTLRLANADLAAALNKVESTVLTLEQSGTITQAEAINASMVINNLTIASDGIEKCADSSTGPVSGCIAPFVTAIQTQMTMQGLGIKSSGAQSTEFQVVIAGVIATLSEITNAP